VIDGTDVRGQDAQPGLRLDEEGAVSALADGAAIGSWPLPVLSLASERLPAAVTDPAGAVASAQALLSDVMKLRSADKIWTMTPGELAPMLTTAVREGTVVLDLDRARLESWLTPVTEVISQTARNPRFRFDAEAQRLSLAEIGHSGRRIDLEATAQRILTASEDPRRVVQVAVTIIPPQVPDNATAAELGIRELIHEETSRFVGSPPERIHNIGVAAARFNGLLVAPEAVFSFNDNIGEVSRETGYEKTLIIMDGATRDGVGGGVCQVSTTLFRAAFWSGLPIVERSAHGYRVAYYEQSAPVGLDATVYQPAPDLRFRNDTGSWLLIETSSDAGKATVTFRILGTKPNRDVQMEGPEVTNVVPPPPPRTEVDPTLPPGTTKQVELARNGASVSITRIIVAGEEETREVFRSKYRPTGAVTAIGPASPSPLPSAAP
jgi:vancomycin resistance protein YoaR